MTLYTEKFKCDNLRQLIKYMRNGIAHYHVVFLSKNSYINGVRIWNVCDKKKTLSIELQINELRAIAEKFIGLIVE